MKALHRAIENPRSLGSRYALLEEWRTANDPRAELLDYQLRYRRGEERLDAKIEKLISEHGRTWAGPIADMVDEFTFHLGLVGEVKLSGEKFLQIGKELFELAPIQHVCLTVPLGSIEAIVNSPFITRLTSLTIREAYAAFGDAGAKIVAEGSAVSHLSYLGLCANQITLAGVEALAASKYLAKLKYVDLQGNPADPTPYVSYEGDAMAAGEYVVRMPDLAYRLNVKFGKRPWLEHPGSADNLGNKEEWAIEYDHIPEPVLFALENRAADLDQRVAAAGNNDDAIKDANQRRARLLQELNAEKLLTGSERVGLRVRECPTLRTYHEAAVEMRSYLSSYSREKFFPGQEPPEPNQSDISLDWFRVPSGYLPDRTDAPGYKVGVYDWLALCERNLIDPMPQSTGERFLRLEGKIHVLHYRLEDGSTPRMWRALPDGDDTEGLSKGQQFAKTVLEEMNKPKSKEREEYEAKKEREDQISALQLYLKTGQITPEQIVKQAVAKLIAAIEKLGPLEKFEQIDVAMLIANREAWLRYAPSVSLRNLHVRYVQLLVGSLTTYITTGTHEEMLAFLRRPTIVAEVLTTGDEAVISMARTDSIHQSEYGWRSES